MTKTEVKELEELGMTPEQLAARTKALDATFTATAAAGNAKDAEEFKMQPWVSDPSRKQNRHVKIALNHMHQRREALLKKSAGIQAEIDELDVAIKALE